MKYAMGSSRDLGLQTEGQSRDASYDLRMGLCRQHGYGRSIATATGTMAKGGVATRIAIMGDTRISYTQDIEFPYAIIVPNLYMVCSTHQHGSSISLPFN